MARDNKELDSLEYKYKKRRRMAVYKFLASALVLIVFFYLAWLLPRSLPRNLFSGLAGVTIVFLFFKVASILQNSWRIVKHGKSYPQYIYEIGNGLAFFENKDMKMCEEMAAIGYLLTNVTTLGFYKFERALPQECSYSVDISDIKYDAEEFSEYLKIFEGGGWEYICSSGSIHWFRGSKGAVPIYTDNASLALKYEKMRKLSLWCVISGILVAIAFFALSRIFPYPVSLMFLFAMGTGIGLALAMSVGVILNHRLIMRLKKLQNHH
ncbi:MAG: DUF2812 domain-containing protein [Defluviitaleaceae bacterium]|nr:DUF2812 domain-containing protein [Defluviitaleaceae bacterium]